LPAPAVDPRKRHSKDLHTAVLHTLGGEIAADVLHQDDILDVEALRERFGVSRSVVRESLRSLQTLGMVRARSKVGTKVTPMSSWALLSPVVIGWRAASHYSEQMRQMLQVRRGIEASAARLCAQHMTDQEATQLREIGHELEVAVATKDGGRFLEADARFHRLILEGSRNPIIAQFADAVAAALRSRQEAHQTLFTETTPDGLRLHVELAEAIVDRDADLATSIAASIADLTLTEFR